MYDYGVVIPHKPAVSTSSSQHDTEDVPDQLDKTVEVSNGVVTEKMDSSDEKGCQNGSGDTQAVGLGNGSSHTNETYNWGKVFLW